MNLAATKIELAQQILNTDDISLIKEIKALLSRHESNWWEELPDEVKKSIKVSLKQIERGETIPHKDAMKRIKEWSRK